MRTITALFESRSDANHARDRLLQLGLPSDDVRVVDQDESDGGQAATREPRGLWESIRDFFSADEDRYAYEEGLRRGHSLLTARVDEAHTDQAIELLERSNAIELDRRQEEWRAEGWKGREAQPTGKGGRAAAAGRSATAGTAATGTTAAGKTEEQRIPVVEEKLLVGKREASRGGVRVRSYVVEEPVHEQVRLRDERVDVERRPVDQPVPGSGAAAAAAADDLLRERSVEMKETTEEPVVGKEARIKEEVVVRKRADERVEQIDDTVRHTEVDVEKDGAGKDAEAARRAAAERERARRQGKPRPH